MLRRSQVGQLPFVPSSKGDDLADLEHPGLPQLDKTVNHLIKTGKCRRPPFNTDAQIFEPNTLYRCVGGGRKTTSRASPIQDLFLAYSV